MPKIRDRASAVISEPHRRAPRLSPAQGELALTRLRPDAIAPTRGTEGAAGLDLYAVHDKIIRARRHDTVSTGIAVAIPRGSAGLIWPRSGMAVRSGIDTLAGVIDSDYRGEIKVELMNHGTMDYTVKRGDRIAQLIIQKVEMLTPVEVSSLPSTGRGAGGFGSSGR